LLAFQIVLTCFIAICGAQIDPKEAKILKEQRFNAGDGRAGAAFATEDGHLFREETDIDGNRLGEYSYIGEDGKTYTVKYSAGKDGFRVLDGSHVPSNGQGAAAFDAQDLAEPEEPVQVAQQVEEQPQQQQQQQPQPQPQQQPQQQQQQQQQQPQQQQQRPQQQPQQQPRPQPPPSQQAKPQIRDYDDVEEVVDPNFNPFVNPHDPTHRDFVYNKNGAAFAPKGPGSLSSNLVPNCADCAGVNPFINPFDATHNQAGLLAGQQAFAASQNVPRVAPQAQRPVQQPVQQQQVVQQEAPVQQPVQQQQVVQQEAPVQQQLPVLRELTTTHAPRFFPPGELKLNRFEV
jgi:hypothetical protein